MLFQSLMLPMFDDRFLVNYGSNLYPPLSRLVKKCFMVFAGAETVTISQFLFNFYSNLQ